MKTKITKGSWIVTLECIVIKEVECNDCTKQQAWDDPFEFANSEQELAQIDWKVTAVHSTNEA